MLDEAALAEELQVALELADPEAVRRTALAVLTRAQVRGRAAIAAQLAANPREAMPAVRAQARLTDALVRAALIVAEAQHGPSRLALIATGGWGRGEMAPFSDVDLLFLAPGPLTPPDEQVVVEVLHILWDLHLEVGNASRSLDDCLQLAHDDMTVRTGLLEMRAVSGDRALARTLAQRLAREVFALPPAPFIEAKLAERETRHIRHGGQRFMLEPNVKEGKGGLRDLHSLYWIAAHVAAGATGNPDAGRIFTREERETFEEAAAFLWAVRCHLHLSARRATERLSFEAQETVALHMGYVDRDGRRAVEQFMQDYFRHATRVGDLTRILLAALEERHKIPAPLLARPRRRVEPRAPFALRLNRLTVADRAAFLAEPLNLLAAFEEAQRVGAFMHPDAMRLIAASLDRIDDALRANPEANRLFLGLLTRHGQPEHALRRMNETGVLGAFVPEFGAVVALVSGNRYHSYTVDEHTLQALGHLARIERDEMAVALPISTDILRRGVNRRVLHVALLLHDCGKALPGDHSRTGARIARAVAPRLGLAPRDVETVEWLVRHHLLMSDMAQKRDISDPRTVRDFARLVGTRERLDLLTVLTVCDISAVGPGVWNNWKAVLLRQLHAATGLALEQGEGVALSAREGAAKRALREALTGWAAAEVRAELQRHEPGYWQGLPGAAHLEFATMLREPGGEARLALAAEPARDATRILVVMADAPGLFANMAGAVARAKADVVDARTWTTRDGRATAAFWVQDGAGHPYAPEDMARLERRIARALAAPQGALPRPPTLPSHLPTAITFDNEASESCTVIEVDTGDRPYLLHDLARAISDPGAGIVSAVIATYGEQVVDTFYVRDRFAQKLAPAEMERIERKLRDVTGNDNGS